MEIKTIALSGAAALVALSFVPFTLPGSVKVLRSAVIPAQPEALFELIASNSGYQKFNPYKTADPDLQITLKGPERGVGSGFDFNGKDGKGSLVIAKVEENRSVTMNIDLGPMGKPVQHIDLQPVEGGTKVTWTMDMEFGLNPIGRVMGLFMDRMVGGTFDQGLANLKAVTAKSA